MDKLPQGSYVREVLAEPSNVKIILLPFKIWLSYIFFGTKTANFQNWGISLRYLRTDPVFAVSRDVFKNKKVFGGLEESHSDNRY